MNSGNNPTSNQAENQKKEDAKKKAQEEQDEKLKAAARREWINRGNLSGGDWYKIGDPMGGKKNQGQATLSSGDTDEPPEAGIYHKPGSSIDIKLEYKDGKPYITPIIHKWGEGSTYLSGLRQHILDTVWVVNFFYTLFQKFHVFKSVNKEMIQFLKYKCGSDTVSIDYNRDDHGSVKSTRRVKALIDMAKDEGMAINLTDGVLGQTKFSSGERRDLASRANRASGTSGAAKLNDAVEKLAIPADLAKLIDADKQLKGSADDERKKEFKENVLQENGADLSSDKQIVALSSRMDSLKSRRTQATKDLKAIEDALGRAQTALDSGDKDNVAVASAGLKQLERCRRLLDSEFKDIAAQEDLVQHFANQGIPAAPASTVGPQGTAPASAPSSPQLDALKARIKTEVTDARAAAVAAGTDDKTRMTNVTRDLADKKKAASQFVVAARHSSPRP